MVKKAFEEIGLDDDFINDGDIEYYDRILQIKMVGRGGGKNVGNRNKGGNGMRNGNVGERLPITLNLVQNDCDDTLAQNYSQNGHTQPEEDNFHSSGNQFENESEGNFSPNIEGQLGKRKRMTKLSGRINMALEATQAMDPPVRREKEIPRNQGPRNQGSGHSIANGENGHNGEGRQSKLKVYIPDDIDRAIGDNARHFVNECGRVVRTRAPLNVKNWKEAFTISGDAMWKEIEGKFEIKEGGSYMKLQAFAVDTMQRLYRLWKARLHFYYKSLGTELTNEERLKYPPPDLPQDQWQYCVERFGSTEFKTQENQGVKPPADVIWLVEHTTRNNEGVLQWADESRSKEIHEQLKVAVATHGDSMTQEEILLDVLKPRSGYFRGKGTALRGYSKGGMQLEHQNLINEQQKQIQVQEQRIKELQETQEKTAKQLQEAQERTSKQLEQQRQDMQRSMEEMKQQLLRVQRVCKEGVGVGEGACWQGQRDGSGGAARVGGQGL
ncbi:Reticulocyte-binding protein 2-like protein a [Bienertia sinuspersici]